MFEPRPDDARLRAILKKDPRYRRGAYDFTRRAVSFASEVYFATGTHVTGRELLEAIRRFALDRYGLMTRDVFEAWGVRATEDFGEIVFNLVDAGLLSKTAEDSRDDFRAVYSFDEAFRPSDYWEEVLESVG
jgi:uncharacterized repeat protein (TIGR04138 family)